MLAQPAYSTIVNYIANGECRKPRQKPAANPDLFVAIPAVFLSLASSANDLDACLYALAVARELFGISEGK